MLKVPIYIYETGSTIYSDLESTVQQGYAPMYQNDLKIFKGVTNTLKFTVKNQDQKPIDISSSNSFVFALLDKENSSSFLNKTMTIKDDGSTRATKGVVEIVLTESDTIGLTSQFYRFSITRKVDGTPRPTYTNTYFDACGRIELIDQCYVQHEDSDSLTTFSSSTNPETDVVTYVSSHVDAHPELKRGTKTHTVQYRTTSYDGSLELEATQDTQPSNGTDWISIKTVTLSNQTGTEYFNVDGVYSWFRIKHIPSNSNTGTLDKVLIRS